MNCWGQGIDLGTCFIHPKIFDNQETPNEIKTSIIIPIYKKSDKKQPENYRGITLLSFVLKLITKITLNKLNMELENNEEQMGLVYNIILLTTMVHFRS